ncbi:MAG: DUF5706 domain-containing protein [Bacteroidota bacterium]|nr:DUF5706 domain-containing protein [Bacteroidota bacterium]
MKKDLHLTLESAILEETKAYATSLLTEKLPAAIVFHTLEHTEEVVKTAEKIGIKSGLNEGDLEVLLVAAWLHDLGYCFDALNPLPESIKAAESILAEKEYPPEQIKRIVNCITATRIPQSPLNLMEKILCDADLCYLASNDYEVKAELLRKETSLLQGKEIPRKEWLQSNLEILKNHRFFTTYGQLKLADKQEENYNRTLLLLTALTEGTRLNNKQNKADKNSSEKEEKEPTRGIETMFRITSHNHLELGAIADNKANIMITINSINLSLIISILFRKFEEYPNLVIPTAILTVVCLLTMVFAVLATRPVIIKNKVSRDDILSKQTNMLFFGNFYKMPLEEYEWGMRQVMKDRDMLYNNMIRDIYYVGQVLGRKYHLLRICYSVFMYGIVLSILSYAFALLFFPAS